MPQSLSGTAFYLKQGKQKGFTMMLGPVCVEHRPELAILIAQIMEASAWLEIALGETLMTMLGSHAPAAMAMYSELTSTATQASARAGAAAVILKPRDLDMFEIVHKIASAAIGERNKIAHAIWALDSTHFPDALLLIDTADHVASQMELAAMYLKEAKAIPEIRRQRQIGHDPSKVLIYKATDFKDILRRLIRARSLVQGLTKLVDPSRETNDRIYLTLLTEPELREAVARLEEKRRKSAPIAQQPPPEKQPPQTERAG